MNKFARMIDVLDLYSESDTVLTAEEIADRLQVSRPTAFRYVRELSTAGFLANYSGRYSLGARIITLDYRIRESDPVLKVARKVMHELAAETASTAILCRMYNEDVINVHHELGYDESGVTFGRGRPLPLFRGSASKTMLAHLPPARLKKIYTQHSHDPDVQKIAQDWPGFREYFARIRQAGHYISTKEVDANVVGIAAPITVAGLGTLGVISLVVSVERLKLINTAGIAEILKLRSREIAEKLRTLADNRTATSTSAPVQMSQPADAANSGARIRPVTNKRSSTVAAE